MFPFSCILFCVSCFFVNNKQFKVKFLDFLYNVLNCLFFYLCTVWRWKTVECRTNCQLPPAKLYNYITFKSWPCFSVVVELSKSSGLVSSIKNFWWYSSLPPKSVQARFRDKFTLSTGREGRWVPVTCSDEKLTGFILVGSWLRTVEYCCHCDLGCPANHDRQRN